MRYRLPPLNGLHAFEAAARHLSFKAAAQELHVTPSAVSQQIRGLEEHVGMPLFHRLTRAVALTEAGRELLPAVQSAFEQIQGAADYLYERERSGPLTVSVPPSLAVKWLVPRLRRFYERFPEIDVRLSASLHVVDFDRDEVDMALRCSHGDHPGLHAEWLMDEASFPVCNPALLEGPHPLRTPEDLRYQTLLHYESAYGAHDGWRDWLRAAGVTGVNPYRGPVFNDPVMAMQAAIEGQGVAISYTPLADTDLAEGRLVRPFDFEAHNTFAYYVVAPEHRAMQPKIAAFRDWVLDEAARDGYRPPRPSPEEAADPARSA